MQASSQIGYLWEVLPHPPGSVVRLFSRGGDSRGGDFARNAREIEQFARAFSDRNIYVAPNPTACTSGERHSAADVTHWSYFLIDMDPVEEKYSAKAALDAALYLLGKWLKEDFSVERGVRPIIIDSGRGMQAWIRLNDLVLDERMRSIARRVNGFWLKKLDAELGLTHGCRIDTSVSDLPRVMRCPGTVNIKTGRMAKFVNTSAHVYTGLAERMHAQVPEKALTDPDVPEGVAPGQPWQFVYHHLTITAQTYLTQGQAEPGRHRAMWHTAKKLFELGVTRREARKALTWANRLQGEEEELEPEQIEHALDTSYGA